MRFDKGKASPPRERPYWGMGRSEPPGLDARIVEIGADQTPKRADSAVPNRREWLSQELWRRRALVVVSLVVLVAVAAVGVDASISGHQPKPGASNSRLAHSSGSASASSSSIPSGGYAIIWTAAPRDTPTPIVYQPPTPTPFQANGWPVTFSSLDQRVNLGGLVIGPDGGIYIQGVPALDSRGNVRPGWLQLAAGGFATVVGFGPDGTIYAGVGNLSDADTRLEAFTAAGRQKPGWDLDFGNSPRFEMGPGGTVYAFSDVGSLRWVTVLDPTGKTKARWSVGDNTGWSCGDAIRPDGTMFYCHTSSPISGNTIAVYGPTGRLISDNPSGGWDRISLSPDGSIYALGFDYEPYSGSVVAQTRIAVIGTDGKPTPGWPVALEGSASPPAFGTDGTIYVAHAGLGTAASQVTAYDRSGNLEAGWPVPLPKGLGTFADVGGNPLAPVVGSNGNVFVAATNRQLTGLIMGYDSSGKVLPGWPYSIPDAFAMVQDPFKNGQNPGPVFVKSPTGQGSLYLLLEGEIVAIGNDGLVAKGWPYHSPGPASAQSYWITWAAAPDGGLVVVSVSNTDVTQTATIVHLTPDGTLAH